MADMNPKLQKVIEKVVALRAHAESAQKINSLEEAEAFFRAADALFQEYRLTEAMLEAAGQQAAEKMEHAKVWWGGKRDLSTELLLRAICKHYGGVFYMTHYTAESGKRTCEYWVVAKESDHLMIDFTLNFVQEEVERLADMLVDSRGKQGPSARMSFRQGASKGVEAQYKELADIARREAQMQDDLDGGNKNSTAMVLLSNRVDEAELFKNTKLGIKFTTRGGIGGGRDRDMYNEGYNAGKNININANRPIGGGGNTPRLK